MGVLPGWAWPVQARSLQAICLLLWSINPVVLQPSVISFTFDHSHQRQPVLTAGKCVSTALPTFPSNPLRFLLAVLSQS